MGTLRRQVMSAHSTTPTLPQAMQNAVAAYQAGRLDEAARFCDLILAAEPRNIDAINIRGALYIPRAEPRLAPALFPPPVEIHPASPPPPTTPAPLLPHHTPPPD